MIWYAWESIVPRMLFSWLYRSTTLMEQNIHFVWQYRRRKLLLKSWRSYVRLPDVDKCNTNPTKLPQSTNMTTCNFQEISESVTNTNFTEPHLHKTYAPDAMEQGLQFQQTAPRGAPPRPAPALPARPPRGAPRVARREPTTGGSKPSHTIYLEYTISKLAFSKVILCFKCVLLACYLVDMMSDCCASFLSKFYGLARRFWQDLRIEWSVLGARRTRQ